MCDGFADDGYQVSAPALFDRYETGVDIGYSPDEITRGRCAEGRARPRTPRCSMSRRRAMRLADVGKVGIVGYCWGGFITWDERIAAVGLACAIAYYGGGMIEAIAEKPACPLMGHFGEWDKMIPVAGVDRLKAAHPDIEVFIYPADHGFNCDQRGSYDAMFGEARPRAHFGFSARERRLTARAAARGIGGTGVASPGPRGARGAAVTFLQSTLSAPGKLLARGRRVRGTDIPSTEDVIITEFCFSTPRIIMQRCRASIITPTPRASMDSMPRAEICSVSRSCNCEPAREHVHHPGQLAHAEHPPAGYVARY